VSQGLDFGLDKDPQALAPDSPASLALDPEGYRNSDLAYDLRLPDQHRRGVPSAKEPSTDAGLGVLTQAEVLPGSAEGRANRRARNRRSGGRSEQLNPLGSPTLPS